MIGFQDRSKHCQWTKIIINHSRSEHGEHTPRLALGVSSTIHCARIWGNAALIRYRRQGNEGTSQSEEEVVPVQISDLKWPTTIDTATTTHLHTRPCQAESSAWRTKFRGGFTEALSVSKWRGIDHPGSHEGGPRFGLENQQGPSGVLISRSRFATLAQRSLI